MAAVAACCPAVRAGGYFKAVMPVIGGATNGSINSLDVTIGSGGAGCSANSVNGVSGKDTVVAYTMNPALGAVTLTAGGVPRLQFRLRRAGAGNYTFNAGKNFYFRGVMGQYGTVSRTVATTLLSPGSPAVPASGNTPARPATYPSFYVSGIGGDGGESGASMNTHGAGGSEYVLVAQQASAFTPYTYTAVFNRTLQPFGVNAVSGVVPEGGGGGAPNISQKVFCGPGSKRLGHLQLVTGLGCSLYL